MRRWIARTAVTTLALGLIALLVWQWPGGHLPASKDKPASQDRDADASGQPASVDPKPKRSTSNDDALGAPPGHPQDVQCARERRAQYQALFHSINPISSAADAVLRALLTPMLDLAPAASLAAERELATASDRWPYDIELAWLSYERCNTKAGCDRQARLARLQQADGDNMLVWLASLTQANQEGAEQAFSEALARAAHAPLYDSRRGTITLRLRPKLQSLALPNACKASPALLDLASTTGRPADVLLHADMQSMAMESAFATPDFRGLLRGCQRREKPVPDQVLHDCRHVLSRLADGDTMLEQLVALPTLIDLTPDQASRDVLRERYRRVRWLQTFGGEIERIDGFLWRTFAEGEIVVLEQHARDTGRWPPPTGWLPDDDRGRKLILGSDVH